MRRTALACLALIVAGAGGVGAQTTVGVVAGASRQEAGASDLPYLGPPFGGTTAAVVGFVDVPFSGRMSIGGEASLSGATSGDQSQRSSSTTYAFTSHHRDSVFSGTFKFTLIDGVVHAAAVAGGGAAYRRTARAVISDFVLAYSFGGDVDVRVTDRLRVLAVARWHRLRDDDLDSNGAVKRGVSSSVFRAGVGAAWRF
jgi:hypothetical protein